MLINQRFLDPFSYLTNDLTIAIMCLTQSDSNRVLTLNLYQYQSQFGIDIPGMMAAVILSVLPILVVYFIGRRSLVDGMMGMGGK